MVGELKSITLTKTPTGKYLNSNSSTALDHSYFISTMGGAPLAAGTDKRRERIVEVGFALVSLGRRCDRTSEALAFRT
jgi:hypothetical protein